MTKPGCFCIKKFKNTVDEISGSNNYAEFACTISIFFLIRLF